MEKFPDAPTSLPMTFAIPAESTHQQPDFDSTMSSSSIDNEWRIKYEEPLYTEIHIDLPRLPSSNRAQSSETSLLLSPPSKSRGRSRTLSSLSPFHRRSSSSTSSKDAEEWPRIRKEVVKSKETHAMMNLRHQNKRNRSSTIDALAVVPAVLVLSAELFTPGGEDEGRRKHSGLGRWEDGIR